MVQESPELSHSKSQSKFQSQSKSQSYDARWHISLPLHLPSLWTAAATASGTGTAAADGSTPAMELSSCHTNNNTNNNNARIKMKRMNQTYHTKPSIQYNPPLHTSTTSSRRMMLVSSYLDRNAMNAAATATATNHYTTAVPNEEQQQQQQEEAMLRLFEPHHPHYLPPTPLLVGMGLPGILLERISTPHRHGSESHSSGSGSGSELRSHHYHHHWMDVASILQDPLQMPVYRMKVVAQAFGRVAGVPVSLQGSHSSSSSSKRGIVLFYASHRSSLDESVRINSMESRLKSVSFMEASAALVSSAITWSLECDAVRKSMEMESSVCHRTSPGECDGSTKEGSSVVDGEESFLDTYFILGSITNSMRRWWNKMKGGESIEYEFRYFVFNFIYLFSGHRRYETKWKT